MEPDLNTVRTLLRVNGLSDTSPDESIRNALVTAGYQEAQVPTILDRLHGVTPPPAPAAPKMSIAQVLGQEHLSALEPKAPTKEKKPVVTVALEIVLTVFILGIAVYDANLFHVFPIVMNYINPILKTYLQIG